MIRSLAFGLVALTAACGTAPPPLSNAQPSPEALAREVLVALGHGDHSRLEALALSEDEFQAHVWPELPVARPERNVPFSYAWGDLRQKSETGLENLLSRYRGRPFELTSVSFDGPTTTYGSYEVRRRSVFTVRGPDGPLQIRVCGSMLHKDGQWKVLSYVTEE